MAESTRSSNAVGRGTEQLEEGGSALCEKTNEAMKSFQDAGVHASRAAQEKLGQLRDSASEYLDQGREQLQVVSRSLESQIKNQPVRSIVIAVGIGFLVGAIWMRR